MEGRNEIEHGIARLREVLNEALPLTPIDSDEYVATEWGFCEDPRHTDWVNHEHTLSCLNWRPLYDKRPVPKVCGECGRPK